MSTLFMAAILLSLSGCFAVCFQRRSEELVAFSALCVMLVLYVCAMLFDSLLVGFYAVLGLSAAAAAVLVCRLLRMRGEGFFRLVLTPGTAVFVLLMLLTWYAHRNRMFSQWDEFSHWGLIVKDMSLFDKLPNRMQSLNLSFRDYPPAASLFSYFWVKLSGAFNEGDVFRANQALILACVLPLFRDVDWKRWTRALPLSVVCFMLPLAFQASAYTTVYVDTLLGCLAGYAVISYFPHQADKRTWAVVCVALFMLPLLKPSGLALALIVCIVIACVRALEDRRPLARRLAASWPVWVSVGLGYGTWSLYKLAVGISGGEPPRTVLQLADGTRQFECDKIVTTFLDALVNPEYLDSGYLFDFSVLAWFALYFAAALLLTRRLKADALQRRRRALLMTLGIGGVVYTLSLLPTYFTSFSQFDAEILASFERYLSTYMVFMFLCLVFVAFRTYAAGDKQRPEVYPLVMLCTLMLVSPARAYPVTLRPAISVSAARDYRHGTAQPYELLSKLNVQTDKIYFIAQGNNGMFYHVSNYLFTPYRLDAPLGWWLADGDQRGTGEGGVQYDLFAQQVTAEEWRDALLRGGYTHLYLFQTNGWFIPSYGELFYDPQTIEGKTLFRIEPNDESAAIFVNVPL